MVEELEKWKKAGILFLLFFICSPLTLAQTNGYIVWSPSYNITVAFHIVPVVKYREVYSRALEEGILTPEDVVFPQKATNEELRLVHSRLYLIWLSFLTKTGLGRFYGENPITSETFEAIKVATGGTITSCRIALEKGVGMNLAGGFHHAFPSHPEGFSHINDVAITIKKLRQDGKIQKAMIVDFDVHHGNGNAYIFRHDSDVFIFDIYQQDNYPTIKYPVGKAFAFHSKDIIDDKTYLAAVDELEQAIIEFKPDIIIYLAGADPYWQDRLGGFQVTMEGLKERDQRVLEFARKHRTPICVTLAGGYAANVNDTIRIHMNTLVVVQAFAKQ